MHRNHRSHRPPPLSQRRWQRQRRATVMVPPRGQTPSALSMAVTPLRPTPTVEGTPNPLRSKRVGRALTIVSYHKHSFSLFTSHTSIPHTPTNNNTVVSCHHLNRCIR